MNQSQKGTSGQSRNPGLGRSSSASSFSFVSLLVLMSSSLGIDDPAASTTDRENPKRRAARCVQPSAKRDAKANPKAERRRKIYH